MNYEIIDPPLRSTPIRQAFPSLMTQQKKLNSCFTGNENGVKNRYAKKEFFL